MSTRTFPTLIKKRKRTALLTGLGELMHTGRPALPTASIPENGGFMAVGKNCRYFQRGWGLRVPMTPNALYTAEFFLPSWIPLFFLGGICHVSS